MHMKLTLIRRPCLQIHESALEPLRPVSPINLIQTHMADCRYDEVAAAMAPYIEMSFKEGASELRSPKMKAAGLENKILGK